MNLYGLVDRTSERWQRIRRHCGDIVGTVDPDAHADRIAAAVEHKTTNGQRAERRLDVALAERAREGART